MLFLLQGILTDITRVTYWERRRLVILPSFGVISFLPAHLRQSLVSFRQFTALIDTCFIDNNRNLFCYCEKYNLLSAVPEDPLCQQLLGYLFSTLVLSSALPSDHSPLASFTVVNCRKKCVVLSSLSERLSCPRSISILFQT